MAVDLKYGRVTLERSTVADDEPVVVFRAQDALLPELLREYRDLCLGRGSPAHHLAAVDRAIAQVTTWQLTHPPRVPTSDSLAPPAPDDGAPELHAPLDGVEVRRPLGSLGGGFGTADPSPHRDTSRG